MCDGMHMGPPVRSGCSRTPSLSSGYYVECCVALDNVGDSSCPADEMTAMALFQSAECPPPPPPPPPPAPSAPPPPTVRPIRGCMDEAATNYNRLARADDGSCQYGAPPLQAIVGCMDRDATNYNPEATYPTASCIYPPPMPPPSPPPPPAPAVTGGTGALAGSGTVGSGCCSSQTCECEGVDSCTVVTDAAFEWVDVMATGTQITEWVNNGDDGWYHVDLPFPFHWFGVVEMRVTIGTNGVLTFGDDQLPYGDSEPVPCQWNGGGQGAGQAGCVQAGDEVTTGGHYGVEIDGIIAVFWCDLNPAAAGGVGEGVYYSVVRSEDERLIAFNKLIVE